MRAREELYPLALPALLCAAVWGVIVARPAARAHVVPQPRQRIERPHTAPRPPSPAPVDAPRPEATPAAPGAEANDAPAVAPPMVAPTSATQVVTDDGRSESILIDGVVSYVEGYPYDGYDNWSWSPAGLAWSRRYFYMRREREARWREWRDARRRRSSVVLAPGSALGPTPDDDLPSLCEVFGAACTPAPAARVTAPTAPSPEPAVVRREGRRWTLANALVEATIDPDALCALSLRRLSAPDSLPPITFATPSSAVCEVAETAPPDTEVTHGAVALAVTWRGGGWWQQVVVSLRDDATSPEASITRTKREGTAVRAEVTNLTGSPLTWTVGGREHTVAPRGVAQLGS